MRDPFPIQEGDKADPEDKGKAAAIEQETLLVGWHQQVKLIKDARKLANSCIWRNKYHSQEIKTIPQSSM